MTTTAVVSGDVECKNNPECAKTKNMGPTHPGKYHIHEPGYSPNRPTWLYLRPYNPKKIAPRSGMFLHPGTLSLGCVTMLNKSEYKKIRDWAVQDKGGDLNVTD